MRILVISNLYPSPTTTTGDIVLTEMRGKGYRDRGHEVHSRCTLLIVIRPNGRSTRSSQRRTFPRIRDIHSALISPTIFSCLVSVNTIVSCIYARHQLHQG